MAPAGGMGGPDSPPSMSDLGLSHFTRRFILEAKKGSPPTAQGKAAGASSKMAAAGAAGVSPTLSASPASPPLPIEKRAAEAAAAVMGTPVITMPTADGERAFPSPVFRTGVKLRHPPARGDARAPSSGPHSAKSSSSTNSSSLPSPQLFEPKSVDRVRKSQISHKPQTLFATIPSDPPHRNNHNRPAPATPSARPRPSTRRPSSSTPFSQSPRAPAPRRAACCGARTPPSSSSGSRSSATPPSPPPPPRRPAWPAPPSAARACSSSSWRRRRPRRAPARMCRVGVGGDE